MLALALADHRRQQHPALLGGPVVVAERQHLVDHLADDLRLQRIAVVRAERQAHACVEQAQVVVDLGDGADRSEEHTSELQSLMRISYAVFCLKKKQSYIQLKESESA